MTVREILTEWLGDNGYDGLYTSGGCACKIDNLVPGGIFCDMCGDCKPGYLIKDEAGEDYEIGEKPCPT